MSTKKEATAALKELPNLLSTMSIVDRNQALTAIKAVDRFVGELRQERSQHKTAAATAVAALESAKRTADERASKIKELQEELHSVKQQLHNTKSQLARKDLTPQERLEQLVFEPNQPLDDSEDAKRVRRDQLIRLSEEMFPNFATIVQEEPDVIPLHQDMFATGYHADEYTVLGMAMKYAGEFGVGLAIAGTCGAATKSEEVRIVVEEWRGLLP